MKVSVLVGSRNRLEVLTRCLQSILTQDYTPLEILVLDDNSDHYRLDELVKASFPDTRLHCWRTEKLLGVAGGRNFLMQQATGDIFCIIDDDACFADNNCLNYLVEAFRCRPNLGIVATKVINHQGTQANLLVPFSRRWQKKRPGLITETQVVSYYLGTCHAIHRRVIEQCGGYQSDLVFGEEELDLSYRAISQGFQIIYLPQVVVHHHPQPSVVGQSAQGHRPELYYHVRNRLFLAYKYLPLKYIPIYLLIWLTIYSKQAFGHGAFKEFLGGLVSGLKQLKMLKRTPLTLQTVKYLKNHYGRLWY